MKLTKVSEKSPFAKDLLARDDCFILDNGANGKIFVWKGNKNFKNDFFSKDKFNSKDNFNVTKEFHFK